MVGIAPKRNTPENGSPALCTARTISSTSLNARDARSAASSPAGVSTAPLRPRSTNTAPRPFSKSLMPAESVGCVTPTASAAATKLPSDRNAIRNWS